MHDSMTQVSHQAGDSGSIWLDMGQDMLRVMMGTVRGIRGILSGVLILWHICNNGSGDKTANANVKISKCLKRL